MQELTAAIFNKKSLFAAIDPAMGKYLTVSVAYRGKLAMRDCESGHLGWSCILWLIVWGSGELGVRVPEQGKMVRPMTGLPAD